MTTFAFQLKVILLFYIISFHLHVVRWVCRFLSSHTVSHRIRLPICRMRRKNASAYHYSFNSQVQTMIEVLSFFFPPLLEQGLKILI